MLRGKDRGLGELRVPEGGRIAVEGIGGGVTGGFLAVDVFLFPEGLGDRSGRRGFNEDGPFRGSRIRNTERVGDGEDHGVGAGLVETPVTGIED